MASGLLEICFQAFWLHCVCSHSCACRIAKSEGLYFEGLQVSNQALWLFNVLNMCPWSSHVAFVCLSMFQCNQALRLPHACLLENLVVLMLVVAT